MLRDLLTYWPHLAVGAYAGLIVAAVVVVGIRSLFLAVTSSPPPFSLTWLPPTRTADAARAATE